jgi:hypothetical protein
MEERKGMMVLLMAQLEAVAQAEEVQILQQVQQHN